MFVALLVWAVILSVLAAIADRRVAETDRRKLLRRMFVWAMFVPAVCRAVISFLTPILPAGTVYRSIVQFDVTYAFLITIFFLCLCSSIYVLPFVRGRFPIRDQPGEIVGTATTLAIGSTLGGLLTSLAVWLFQSSPFGSTSSSYLWDLSLAQTVMTSVSQTTALITSIFQFAIALWVGVRHQRWVLGISIMVAIGIAASAGIHLIPDSLLPSSVLPFGMQYMAAWSIGQSFALTATSIAGLAWMSTREPVEDEGPVLS